MHLNLILKTVLVEFNFVHFVPAIDAEFAGKSEAMNIEIIMVVTKGNLVRNNFNLNLPLRLTKFTKRNFSLEISLDVSKTPETKN